MTRLNFNHVTGMLSALSLLLGACGTTHFVSIRHPLHVGSVDQNSVPFNAARDENARSLPTGSLTDSASLTLVEPDRICAELNLWTLDEEDVSRGDYNNYRIAMLNDQDGVEVSNGEVQLGQPQTQAYNGTMQERQPHGFRNVCARYANRRCVSWRREQVYITVNVPHTWQVTNHPATICFGNNGFITPATTRVSIEMDGVGPGSMTFEWQFESAVAAGPAPAQDQSQN